MLRIYLCLSSHLNFCAHVVVIIAPSYVLTASSRKAPRPLSFVRRLYRYSYTHPADLIRLLGRSGYNNSKLPDVIHKVSAAWLLWARYSSSLPFNKLSFARVDSAFNNCLQKYCVFCFIRNTNYC